MKTIADTSRGVPWWWRALLIVWLSAHFTACGSPPPLRVAVMMPPLPLGQTRNALQWAVQNVNAAGGIWGRTLIAEEVPIDPRADVQTQQQQIARVAADETYVAVIGPGNSETLAVGADLLIEHKKPVVSFNSTAADILRAYGGTKWIWRTRESDIGQAELLARFAVLQGAGRLSLLTSTSLSGQTFLSWFGFFARDLGYAADAVRIDALDAVAGCDAAMSRALAPMPELLFVAGATPGDYDCVVRYARSHAQPKSPRIVFADTGLDAMQTLRMLGPLSEGVEGFQPVSADSGSPTSFEAQFRERFGSEAPPHGASEYDAVLLLAYGLTQSKGEGGEALANAIAHVVSGRGERMGFDVESIERALSALRQDETPNLSGATGELDFEPDLLTDLSDSTFAHWIVQQGQRRFTQRFFTGERMFRTSSAALVPNSLDSAMNLSGVGGSYQPAAPKRDVWALIAAVSSGWNNYRHQADALRQYALLRRNGVPDDHIVLVMADDLATARQNLKPGVVQNEMAGSNLRRDAQLDYGLQLSASELMDVLAGRVSATTPTVLQPSQDDNLYVYLVGHGGEQGIPIGANTAADGLAGRGSLLSPSMLRDTLCQLQSQGKLRRALIVVESCFGGVFGEATSGGLEAGCDGGLPLQGTVLLSAAGSDENSVATSYDPTISAWLADEFSQQLARFAESHATESLVDAFKATYVGVRGSHVSIYNTPTAGLLSHVSLGEFIRR